MIVNLLPLIEISILSNFVLSAADIKPAAEVVAILKAGDAHAAVPDELYFRYCPLDPLDGICCKFGWV